MPPPGGEAERAAPLDSRGRLARFSAILAGQAHLCAVRDGVVAALPIVLASSALLLLAQPPLPVLARAVAPIAPQLLLAVRALNGGLALYVAFAAAQSLARRRGIDPVGPAIAASAALLLAAVLPDGRLPLERLNQAGLFAGLALGLTSAELGAWAERRDLAIRLPPGVPESIARSFASIVPAAALVLGVLSLRALDLDLIGATQTLAKPLVAVAGSLPGVLLVCLVDAGLYFLGIHPAGILAALQPLWLSMLVDNQAARLAGQALPHIATREFYLWFVWQGGSGGTLGLALCLLLARAPSLRTVSRLSLVPAVFNVNEPLLFGLPIVLNPVLAMPFLLGPLLSASIAYAAFYFGWVARPAYEVLWTLPAPLGALLACADPRALLLELATLALSAALWWPFVRGLDRVRGPVERAASAVTMAPAPEPD